MVTHNNKAFLWTPSRGTHAPKSPQKPATNPPLTLSLRIIMRCLKAPPSSYIMAQCKVRVRRGHRDSYLIPFSCSLSISFSLSQSLNLFSLSFYFSYRSLPFPSFLLPSLFPYPSTSFLTFTPSHPFLLHYNIYPFYLHLHLLTSHPFLHPHHLTFTDNTEA